jgi:hypothetical protein
MLLLLYEVHIITWNCIILQPQKETKEEVQRWSPRCLLDFLLPHNIITSNRIEHATSSVRCWDSYGSVHWVKFSGPSLEYAENIKPNIQRRHLCTYLAVGGEWCIKKWLLEFERIDFSTCIEKICQLFVKMFLSWKT